MQTPISRQIWQTKYRFGDAQGEPEQSIQATWRRVAKALATVEPSAPEVWAERFYRELEAFRFLPGGRILAGAGTGRRVTLYNCFVMGIIEDSMEGIFEALKEGALTMQQGGGVGYDFSTLRPRGAPAKAVGGVASGPVSFMGIWDSMCRALLSTGARRGAMMATLRCDHPDIERFVDAKRDPKVLRSFNLSVLVTDAFVRAVREDAEWPLVFPEAGLEEGGEGGHGTVLERCWPGFGGPVPCRVWRVVQARALWDRLMLATYACAEPGVLFIDRINRLNNLAYCERIHATNPCGEIPLPPYGACDLGSINLTRFVEHPFSRHARIDLRGIDACVAKAVRMLDNVIDVSLFPLPAQARQARASRRIGLGVTGLADALILLGRSYRSPGARRQASEIMRRICESAYRSSVGLAEEKGAFPQYRRDAYLGSPFVRSLPEDIRERIGEAGIRNSHLLAIAPAGTISLLADNLSSGVEPVFEFSARRRILAADGGYEEHLLDDYALALWRELKGRQSPPDYFVRANDIAPGEHLEMQAALQPFVDSAISKTVQVPEDFGFEAFKGLYETAYQLGLKGCTTFRPNPVTGSVVQPAVGPETSVHCCSLERETD